MTTKTAQKDAAYAQSQTIGGVKVWPCAYGHIHWLTSRKNAVITQKGKVNDFVLAEVCFALTNDPKTLQSIKGVQAKSQITSFLMESTSKTLMALWTHASKEIESYFSSMAVPKKAKAQAVKNRKPATRVRKR